MTLNKETKPNQYKRVSVDPWSHHQLQAFVTPTVDVPLNKETELNPAIIGQTGFFSLDMTTNLGEGGFQIQSISSLLKS